MPDIARDKDGNVIRIDNPAPAQESSNIAVEALDESKPIAVLDADDLAHFARLYNAMEAQRLTLLAHASLYDTFSAQLQSKYELPNRWELDWETGEITDKTNYPTMDGEMVNDNA